LKKEHTNAGIEYTALQTECPTCWSSASTMIDCLLTAHVPIILVMVKLQEIGSTLPLTLSEEKWKVLKDLSRILSSAKEVLTLLQN